MLNQPCQFSDLTTICGYNYFVDKLTQVKQDYDEQVCPLSRRRCHLSL